MKYHSSEYQHSKQFPDTSGSFSDRNDKIICTMIVSYQQGENNNNNNSTIQKKELFSKKKKGVFFTNLTNTYTVSIRAKVPSIFTGKCFPLGLTTSPFQKWVSHTETRHSPFRGQEKGRITKTWWLLPWFPHQTRQRMQIFSIPMEPERLWRCLSLLLHSAATKGKFSSWWGWDKDKRWYQLEGEVVWDSIQIRTSEPEQPFGLLLPYGELLRKRENIFLWAIIFWGAQKRVLALPN